MVQLQSYSANVQSQQPKSTRAGRPGDLGPVLDSIRADVDEQFRISERIDTKARNLIAVAGAFFTVVQALAKDAIVSSSTSADERIVIAALGVVAALMLVAAIVATAGAWRLLNEGLMPEEHFERLVDEVNDGSDRGPRDLSKLYLLVLGVRRENNVRRARRLSAATGLCMAAVLAALAELIVTFAIQA
jgi:hypothetical protein